jgi:hypothetical protein
MKKNLLTLPLWVALIIVGSCKLPYDDIDTNIDLTPEVAVPILDKTITMNDMLKGVVGNGFVELQNDGSYVVKYSTNFTSPSTLDVFANTPESPRIPIVQPTMVLPFPSPNGTRIDEIEYKTGGLNCFIRLTNDDTLKVRIMIDELTKAGKSFDTTVTVMKPGFTGAFNFTGWTLSPKNSKFTIVYSAKDQNALNVFVDNQSFYQLTKFESRLVKGYLGEQLMAIPEQTLNIDFFKNWKKQGDIRFVNPRMRLFIENSLGMPIRLKSTVAEVIDGSGKVTPFDFSLKNGEDIMFPTMSEIGKSKQTVVTNDISNSNIVDVVNAYPEKFRIVANAFVNPDPNNTTAGFLTDKSQLITRLDFELPLNLTAKGFVVYDTLENIDFSKTKNIIEGEFKVITINGLPVDLNLQGYFVDGNGQVLDSLIQKNTLLLNSATLNANGTIASETTAYNYVYVTSKQFNNIRNTKRMIAKFTMGTSKGGSQPVKIFSRDRVTLKLGLKAKVSP